MRGGDIKSRKGHEASKERHECVMNRFTGLVFIANQKRLFSFPNRNNVTRGHSSFCRRQCGGILHADVMKGDVRLPHAEAK